jgi:Uma2 family endonuclease
MVTTEVKGITLEEYRALPEGPPHYEFEEGALIPVTSPTRKHQAILLALATMLRSYVRDRKLGSIIMELDVYLPDGRVFIPDLLFLSTEQLNLIDPGDDKVHGAPDLVVEITSSVPARDRVHKFRVYYDNGVPRYWVVDGETLAIEEYHATPDGYLRTASVDAGEEFRPRLFPEMAIDLAKELDVSA